MTIVSKTLWAQPPTQTAPPNPNGPYTVTLVPPAHGKVTLSPALPADGKYPKGTVVTVTATPTRATSSTRCGTRWLVASARCTTRG